MTCQALAILVLTGAAGAMGSVHDLQKRVRTTSFLASDLRPDLVARTLVDVVNEWKAQASTFMECNATDSGANCGNTPKAFQKSCGTVTMSIVTGSSGDRDVVKEYMADVCGQKVLDNYHHDRCNEIKDAIGKAMVDNSYENRENFNSQKLCSGFWSKFVETERVRFEKEAAERAEAEKKAAEERAAAQKKAEEEAKVKAEEEAKEAKQKAEEQAKEAAAKAAELAKKQVEEAAAKLAEKKAEAEEVARAAKQKMEEAQKAEQEHHDLLSKANSTALGLSSATGNSTQVKPADDLETVKQQAKATLEKAASVAADATKAQDESKKTVTKAANVSSAPLAPAAPANSTVKNSSKMQQPVQKTK
mmetsp:Transcript_126922/g.237285  ORF Transcript_126922/g.237285 Transcript_126922/m.237285 type:complete len:362 (+) Transcript_126922:65-1150(+)